jgi:hypothetical protein
MNFRRVVPSHVFAVRCDIYRRYIIGACDGDSVESGEPLGLYSDVGWLGEGV